MYKQTLYSIEEDHIKPQIIKRMNRYNKWEYGYNAEHDVIVISKTGKIGEIYNIQNLKIALPAEPKEVYKRSSKKEEQYWEASEYPKELTKIKSVFDWEQYPSDFKEKWFDYIDQEFTYRDNGFWYYSNGKPTYISGTHYMYLQWTKIDVGHPDYTLCSLFVVLFHFKSICCQLISGRDKTIKKAPPSVDGGLLFCSLFLCENFVNYWFGVFLSFPNF